MPKTKLRHLHKIKVHHNRWLIWAVAYTLMVAIAMVGYIKISDVNFDSQFEAENKFQSWRSYSDERLGFAVRYPGDWGIEADGKASINFVPNDLRDEGVTIAVHSTSVEDDLRDSLNIIAEKIVAVDGAKGAQITNDLGQNAWETFVLVRKNKKLYSISGSDDSVQKFLLTFRFINP